MAQCISSTEHPLDLSPLQFRDGLAIRYVRDPPCLPPRCDGCGTTLTLQHALDCKKGRFIIQRHNEIRDCLGDIASHVWTHVIKEPVVREADVNNGDDGLQLDLGTRGVWQPQMAALFDIRVIDTDAPSHRMCSPEAILETGAKEKKWVYEQAVVEWRGNFTPIVLSVDGLLHREAERFLKRIAANLAHKWEMPYSQTCGYVRARLAFAIIRATSLCLRCSQVKWRSGLGMDDGTPLYSIL